MRETAIKIGAGIVIGMLLFLVFRGCNKSINTTKTETIRIRDTLTKTRVDSFYDTVKIVKRATPDTVYKEKKPKQDYHTVHSKYEDSLLKARVSTDLKGKLINQSLNYEVLSPREKIVKTDSVFIKDSVHTKKTVTKNPWRVGIGMEVEGSKTYFDFAPAISVEKDGVQLKYEYNILNKTHEIGVQKKFNLSNL